MVLKTVIAVTAATLLAGAASADCTLDPYGGQAPVFDATPPAPLDIGLRPRTPACLQGLASPEQQSCPRDELADYARSVEAWGDALNRYVRETNDYANAAARHANDTVEFATGARGHADASLAYAECEARRINDGTE